jgi:hypothetical protein
VDRTAWELGGCVFNILMLGVVHQGVAFPLLLWLLDKKGNSNSGERMGILAEFFEVFPDAQINFLSGDREFVGAVWLQY